MLHIDNEEVRDLFSVGTEIDTFSCVEELSDKIDFYLTKDDLRRKMVARAYARATSEHSYTRRAIEVDRALHPLTIREA
ncbi:hypothetical protein GCM10011515_23590 [Tsuneonella deserti]|uniref:Spore protein YkvP/CgeB glycosyl transferase-like domain-containing protein n=2 Tax=Tsuneonella deserti TaxID=2035528 RepID=A0ABQ1SC10_9SPHN|nr:hypothetical protein GCM10011515_23590 [Tsuneonella deserti]